MILKFRRPNIVWRALESYCLLAGESQALMLFVRKPDVKEGRLSRFCKALADAGKSRRGRFALRQQSDRNGGY